MGNGPCQGCVLPVHLGALTSLDGPLSLNESLSSATVQILGWVVWVTQELWMSAVLVPTLESPGVDRCSETVRDQALRAEQLRLERHSLDWTSRGLFLPLLVLSPQTSGLLFLKGGHGSQTQPRPVLHVCSPARCLIVSMWRQWLFFPAPSWVRLCLGKEGQV